MRAPWPTAVLKAACEGHLVPTEVDLATIEKRKAKLEAGKALLARILNERRQNWHGRRKYKEPAAPNSKKLGSLANGWTQATVEQLTSLVATGATPLRGKSDFWNSGRIPWVTSGALNNDFVTEAFEFITPSAIQKTNAKVFPAGTLLVALYGEGKTRGKVSELKINAATNQACAALLFDSSNSAMRPYLKVFLQKNYEAVRLLASGGVQPNLSLSIMKNTVVPLPPLVEQTRIVAEVERRLSVVGELDALVSANLQRAKQLQRSILNHAFQGRFDTQDENDRPVAHLSDLLKSQRIMKARTKAKTQRAEPSSVNGVEARVSLNEALRDLPREVTLEHLCRTAGYNPALTADVDNFFQEVKAAIGKLFVLKRSENDDVHLRRVSR